MWPVPLSVASSSKASSRRASQVWERNPLEDASDDDAQSYEAQSAGYDYFDDGYGDDQPHDGRISLRMHGEQRRVRVEAGTTVGGLLRVLAPKDREGKTIASYAIMQAEIDGQGRLRQWVPLEADASVEPFILSEEEDGLPSSDRIPLSKSLQLVDRSAELCIFLNAYFRMLTGCPLMVLKLYAEAGETVVGLVNRIKASLGLSATEDRFWLFANYRTHVDRLEPTMAIGELKEKDDPTNPHLFQFQMLPECEDTSLLGIIRSGNLLLHSDKALMGAKKWFFYLQGTTLFYQPTRDQRSPRKRIDNLHLCRITYRGSNPNHTLYRFDITLPNGENKIFSSPLKKRVERWVRELRKAHPSTEIGDCVDMAEVIKQEQCRAVSHPPAADPRASTLPSADLLGGEGGNSSGVTFDQRRAIETMEAHFEKIEMDAGLLQLNGMDPELGRKWAEAVRILLLQAVSVEATPKTARQVVPRIYEVLCRLRRWVRTIEREEGIEPSEEEEEDGDDPDADPLELIPEVVSECTDLTQTYRYCILGLGNPEDDGGAEEPEEVDEETEELCDMMGKLKISLDQPIFRAKATRRPSLKPNGKKPAGRKQRLPSLNRQHIDQRPTRRYQQQEGEEQPGLFKRVIRFLSTSPRRDPSVPRTVKHYMEDRSERGAGSTATSRRSSMRNSQRDAASVRSLSRPRSISRDPRHHQSDSALYVNAYQMAPHHHHYAEPALPARVEESAPEAGGLSSFMAKVMGRQAASQPASQPAATSGFAWAPAAAPMTELGPMAHDPRFQSLCREYAMSSQTSLNQYAPMSHLPPMPSQSQQQSGSLETELVDELCRNDRLVDLIIRRRLMAR